MPRVLAARFRVKSWAGLGDLSQKRKTDIRRLIREWFEEEEDKDYGPFIGQIAEITNMYYTIKIEIIAVNMPCGYFVDIRELVEVVD